jgi:hypothetical protein
MAHVICQALNGFGQSIHDSLPRRGAMLEDPGNKDTDGRRGAQRDVGMPSDLLTPIQLSLYMITEAVDGFRYGLALGGDILPYFFGAPMPGLFQAS